MNLAYKLRPVSLSEFVGQDHLVGKGKIIRAMIEGDQLFSMIFWGPPGSGKTTLATIIAKVTHSEFYELSGVESGKGDLKDIILKAKEHKMMGRRTILFIDEIHRWNKAQQDALLPYVESGLLTLIGATTENPSFEVISALLSRCRVFVLSLLEKKDLLKVVNRALSDEEKGMGKAKKRIGEKEKELLIQLSGGDARVMLNGLEIAVTGYKEEEITKDIILEIFQKKSGGLYDKKGEEHYNLISAFIKSMRGSDVDATLYYMHRILENGEDPKFVARRMIIFASEDIGLADRGALIQANAAFEAVTKIGMPESKLILSHIAIYLSCAPKSRAVAGAMGKAIEAVYQNPAEPVPLHLRNAPTKLMKDLGYAKGYTWSEEKVGPTETKPFLPDKLKGKKFFEK
ncbi:AAA family ATPase [Candidatus Gottesmanbacteria bacterium RIFCSPHIGHO2_02_FULL_39_11]|uniref:AAA family ATPase n=1 Tax=Candidatus Gottesmanbacteria bacterium RIFCSPHIGHO2_02_FULL_39_11 TaxID=1798382 RepID=A0A1F5ZP79_9BACT|nr:MAG: AAA family ATPase [Candidatus Gottesmanbacteria bacterium RIFCSPHIGHO2_02_FULL_39_11]